ncbi:MAG: hypothetical protein AAFY72_03170, partial [Cyanobacteria bacterium J06649_4]
IETVRKQLQSAGWALNEPCPMPDLGFLCSGFQQMSPTFFFNPALPHQKLRLWTRPAAKGVNVQVWWDVDPDQVFTPHPSVGVQALEGLRVPRELLTPLPDSVVYSSGAGYGGKLWNASTYLRSAQSMDTLRQHYEAQLIHDGWRLLAHSEVTTDDLNLYISSFTSEGDQGEMWQALLRVKPAARPNDWEITLDALPIESR